MGAPRWTASLGIVEASGPWPWVFGLLVAVALVALWQRFRRRNRVRELLFRDVEVPEERSAAAKPEPEFDDEPGALAGWLGAAGYEGASAPLQFIMWSAAALLTGAFLALVVDASGFSERAILWLREIPGGIADLFVPVMRGMTWLVALLIAMIPVTWVRRERRRRAEEVERDLPTVLGMLATLVESGLGFDAAALRVERALGEGRVLTYELRRVRTSILSGIPRATAIRAMAQRFDVPSLTTFSSSLVHAENQGASIGDTLRRQATDLWARRREEAIQRAQTLPTKLAFPLVLCFLPGVFVWTFGPAVAEFVRLAGSVAVGRP